MRDIIEFNTKRVANLLKVMVNQTCEDGFQWYTDIGEMPTIFDINHAIHILDNMDTEAIEYGYEEE